MVVTIKSINIDHVIFDIFIEKNIKFYIDPSAFHFLSNNSKKYLKIFDKIGENIFLNILLRSLCNKEYVFDVEKFNKVKDTTIITYGSISYFEDIRKSLTKEDIDISICNKINNTNLWIFDFVFRKINYIVDISDFLDSYINNKDINLFNQILNISANKIAESKFNIIGIEKYYKCELFNNYNNDIENKYRLKFFMIFSFLYFRQKDAIIKFLNDTHYTFLFKIATYLNTFRDFYIEDTECKFYDIHGVISDLKSVVFDIITNRKNELESALSILK